MSTTNSSCNCDCDKLDIKTDNDDYDFYDKQFRDLFTNFNEQFDNYPEIKEFILKLKTTLEKQIKKIKKLKQKLKECQEQSNIAKKDVETQTEHAVESKSIVEEITEAARDVVQETGFVYETTSGLYYDYKTGYYYNAEYGLYYDGNTGIYYKYNEDTKQFDFHSKVDVPTYESTFYDNELKRKDTKIEREDMKRAKRDESSTTTGEDVKSPHSDTIEEGECTDTSDSCAEDDEKVEVVNADTISKETQEISKAWPPCMRIIVQESKLDKLREGTLFVITCDGGSIGREGDHILLIPDINVSKHHATVHFNKNLNQYEIVDLGSRNGTLLDGKRMSVAKQESEPIAIKHGSVIQLGNTKLLCHIHSGNETCRQCEPGLQLHQKSDTMPTSNLKTTNRDQYKSELKRLKKKFGIDNSSNLVTLGEGYSDRAQHRRDTVGSTHSNEKTEIASIDQKISSENKGFKLLKSMGWSEGESLGKEKSGITEPVPLISNVGHTGLGCNKFIPTSSSSIAITKKDERWQKMHERYQSVNDSENNAASNEEGES